MVCLTLGELDFPYPEATDTTMVKLSLGLMLSLGEYLLPLW